MVETIRTVLHVDDQIPARLARTRVLRDAGFEVREVETAADAVERAPEASVMLLDLGLPGADGFTVCERVRQVAPDLPIIMVTSIHRTAQARRDGFAVGADAFLLEPVPPEQLVRVVEQLMHRRTQPPAALEEAWVLTDAAGNILDLSQAASSLLNLSRRGARGRSLPAFFVENRPKLHADLLRAADGLVIERASVIQPRDRRPVPVRIDVSALPHEPGARVELRWVLVADADSKR